MNMTWEDFKRAVESQGVTDTDEIAWIDMHPFDLNDVAVSRDQDGKVQISDGC